MCWDNVYTVTNYLSDKFTILKLIIETNKSEDWDKGNVFPLQRAGGCCEPVRQIATLTHELFC